MGRYNKILLSLGRIEGEFVEMRKLNQRVCALEQMQSWLKGGCAALAVAFAGLCRGIYGK